MEHNNNIIAVVPAAGIGNRMQTSIPKQYLPLAGKTVIEHTLSVLLSYFRIKTVIVVISPDDTIFTTLSVSKHPKLTIAYGGKNRVDSVLAGLQMAKEDDNVLVHDAARPCLTHKDIDALLTNNSTADGAILASPLSDTIKMSNGQTQPSVESTLDRRVLWRALTPQYFNVKTLKEAIMFSLHANVDITDEASAIEYNGGRVDLIEGSQANIKITFPCDLALASFYLQQTKEASCV